MGFLHWPNLAADSAASAHMQAGTHSSSLDGTGAHTRRRERQLTVRGYTHMNHPPLLRQFTGLVAVVPSTGLASSVVRDTTLEGDGVKPPHHRLTNLVTRRAASARRPLSIRPYRRGHILYSASLALGPIAATGVVAGFLHRPNLAADCRLSRISPHAGWHPL